MYRGKVNMPDNKMSLKVMQHEDLKVKNSGFIRLKYIENYPDGNIGIGEVQKEIPFEIKRFYFIKGMASKEIVRGKLAHHTLDCILFCVSGSFSLLLDDGMEKQTILMDLSSIGIRIGPMLWHEMTEFSKDCVILVVANDFYDEKDYIRNYEEFLELLKNKKGTGE